MKKIVCALVVLMFAVPASAAVTITVVQEVALEPNVIIGYTGDELVRCFGLNIQLDNDETIIAVECLSNDFYIGPGNFTYDGVTPDFGAIPCLCNPSEPDTLGGIDTNGITIAMCSLYADNDPDHNEPPATSNGLIRLTVSGKTCITITENGARGGVIDEDSNDIGPVLPPDPCCVVLPPKTCMGEDHPDFDLWQSLNEPNCWCYPRQCRGDIDDNQEYGTYWVLMLDLAEFQTYFGETPITDPPGICCDFAHDIEYGTYRVLMNDLAVFQTYFGETTVPCCDLDENCDETDDDYFNFWLPL